MARLWLAAALTATGLLACHRPPNPTRTLAGPASDRLPSLRLDHRSQSVETSPNGLPSPFVIGRHGAIVLYDDRGDGFLYSVLDSAGQFVRRIGKVGDGPGEVRGGALIDLDDSTFLLDQQTRLSRFALDGRLLESRSLHGQVFFRVAVSDTEALGLLPSRGGFFPGIGSVSGGPIRQLVPASDSFMAASFPPGVPPDGQPRIGVLGLRPDGFVFADGWNYRLALYNWDGKLVRILSRDLPRPMLSTRRLDRDVAATLFSLRATRGRLSPADSAHMRDQIARTPQPFFRHTGRLGLDAQGRTWVVGIDADSGYADLFNEDRFLGRIPLPCADFDDGWSVRGNWLALACAPDDPAFPGDAVFQVFRIVD